MHYRIVKMAPKVWRLFAQTVEGGYPVKLQDCPSRAGAWCKAQLLLGRARGSIQVVDREAWTEWFDSIVSKGRA